MSDNIMNTMKSLPFWIDDPTLWFAKTEAQYWSFNVKDDFAKFNYVIAQLDKHCLTVVKDVVLSPPDTNKYETLKSEILSRLKESKIKQIKEILEAEPVGDRKPSEFLNHLKGLAGPEVDDKYLKSVWSSRLPPKVQWVSSFLTSSSLEKIAQLADLAMNSPSMKPPQNKPQFHTADAKSEISNDDAMKKLNKRIEELTIKVEDLSSTSNKSEVRDLSTKSPTGAASATKTASTLSQFSPLHKKKHLQEPLIICWYHNQFGWAATKCVQPCKFTVSWLSML